MTKQELLALADAYVRECYEDVGSDNHSNVEKARAALEAALDGVCRDAEKWRAHQSRKSALLAAGFGRNPLRNEQDEQPTGA